MDWELLLPRAILAQYPTSRLAAVEADLLNAWRETRRDPDISSWVLLVNGARTECPVTSDVLGEKGKGGR